MKKHFLCVLILFSVLCLGSTAFGTIIIGRIAYTEGQIYRYMDVDKSWVETFAESPAGSHDALASGNDSRAEISFPNNMLLRLDENAEVEILNLEEDVSGFVLQKGLARFYNLGTAGSMVIETVRGRVVVGPESIVDIQVEGNSVVVSAVQGEATFQSQGNGVEKLEVISGSTSLEFHENSITAGSGSIDRRWDRWCAGREEVRTKNQLVRSAYLPETMQQYAHVLEANGSWRRIYYRGYNYWAWQPRRVAVGWAPYTTGSWYDWQGGPVWIDHNSWGWATHHHGHWIHKHGAWMWTPYVHVAQVPGVTAIGFNIVFGRAYRPHWHPGRVRWISHSSHVGWLPLAPWETYYGHRRWGPRSVVHWGGAGFSIKRNLSHHRYVDHAVIIPKRHFHHRGKSGALNSYNTVRIQNIDKTIIVNNYRAVPAVTEQKNRHHAPRVTGGGKAKSSPSVRSEYKTTKNREVARFKKQTRKDESLDQLHYRGQKKRVDYNNRQTAANEHTGTREKSRAPKSKESAQKRVGKSAHLAHATKVASQEKRGEKSRNIGHKNPRGSSDIVSKRMRRKNGPGQALAQNRTVGNSGPGNKAAAVEQSRPQKGKKVVQKSVTTQRQVQKNHDRVKGIYKKRDRKHTGKEAPKEVHKEKQKGSGQKDVTLRARKQQGNRQRTGRSFSTASSNQPVYLNSK